MKKRLIGVVMAGAAMGLLGPALGAASLTAAHACPASEWQPNPPPGWQAAHPGQTWQNPSTPIAATPDNSTVVYQDGTNPAPGGNPGWVGVYSGTAASAGFDGYVELNSYGNPDYPAGYVVAAGNSPAGSGGVAVDGNHLTNAPC